LTGLITQAFHGTDTSRAAISTMLGALQSQLTGGPLPDLNSGAVDGNGFVAEAQGLETSYEQNVDQQLLPHFTHIDKLLKLQGQGVVAVLTSLNEQSSVGLITGSDLVSEAQTAINSLSNGPIFSLGTPLNTYISTSEAFDFELTTAANSLGTSASTSLSLASATSTMLADAEAYRAEMHIGLQVTHPNISSAVDSAVSALEQSVIMIGQSGDSSAQTDLNAAIATFDSAILGSWGLFGSRGRVSQVNAQHGYVPWNLTVTQDAASLGSVSGTAALGSTATLTATLTDSATGQGIVGVPVTFTLAGAFAGVTFTGSGGVATVGNVPTTALGGTTTGTVVAYFAGDFTHLSATGAGDLTVSQAATTLSNVSGTAAFGGTATLSATLTSAATNQGLSGETVSFTLDGTSVGSATTNSSGVATLTGVATSDAAGTHTGAVVASFAGDTNYQAAPSGTGDLVVNQAGTTLGSVSGAGASGTGGTATLTATLTSSVTNQGIEGETVSFSLGGTSVGTATTNSSGVATLPNVSTAGFNSGTTTGAITASYAGSSNYQAATNATGDLALT
jgi:hypothetical protein